MLNFFDIATSIKSYHYILKKKGIHYNFFTLGHKDVKEVILSHRAGHWKSVHFNLNYPSQEHSFLNIHPLNQWCHPTISSSVTSFSSCPQSFTASGSLPMSWLFTSGGGSYAGLYPLLSTLWSDHSLSLPPSLLPSLSLSLPLSLLLPLH